MVMFLALIFVIALFLLLVLLLRKIRFYGNNFFKNNSNFKVIDVVYLDSNNKIFNMRHSETEYVLLLSKNGNLLLEKRSATIIDA